MSAVELTIWCGIAAFVAGMSIGVLVGWALKAVTDDSAAKSLDEDEASG